MEREKPQSKISLFEEVGKLQQLNKKDMRTEELVLHQKKKKKKKGSLLLQIQQGMRGYMKRQKSLEENQVLRFCSESH